MEANRPAEPDPSWQLPDLRRRCPRCGSTAFQASQSGPENYRTAHYAGIRYVRTECVSCHCPVGFGAEHTLPQFLPLPTASGEAHSSMYEPVFPSGPAYLEEEDEEDEEDEEEGRYERRAHRRDGDLFKVAPLVGIAAVALIGFLIYMTPTDLASLPAEEGNAPPLAPEAAAEPVASGNLLSGAELAELRQFALGLINQDRADHELPPVALGTNPAAQMHAEDMLEHNYLGHWWADGRKPYMVYSETGGTSYAGENVASRGWTDQRWNEASCGNWLTGNCRRPVPRDAIEQHQWNMMYDDAHADWGHRDNILGEGHKAVNIGIASNGRRVTFVQHFEGGAAQAERPTLDGSVLSLHINHIASGVEVGNTIGVFHDPLPTAKTLEELEALDSYCTGGGFTTECGDAVASIVKPPSAGRYYPDLDPNDVIASSWVETPTSLLVTADLGGLATEPGVYTVTVWRDTDEDVYSEVLIKLTALDVTSAR